MSQDNLQVSNETLLTIQKGQVTERFTRAIDQLGTIEDGKPNLEIRLGGIYALEGIARDSEEYRTTVVEVLSAYVRQNTKADTPDQVDERLLPVSEDTLAIMSAFARLRQLFGADIRPNLSQVNLQRRALHEIRLTGVNLSSADLSGAGLVGADLREANLQGANLSGAYLHRADLTGAQLSFAVLTHADLTEAKLTDASLSPANVAGANLAR